MKKAKWSVCVLAAAMVIAMLPFSAFAAEETAVLTVDGVNALETPSGQGWSYQKENGTLTLDGYDGGPIHADGLSLNVVLAENSNNTITSDVSENRSALGSNTFGYSDNDITIIGEGDGSASLNINGDLQGIYAQGDVTVQNCALTVDIVPTEASEEEVENGTRSGYIFIGARASGGLLLEDATLDVAVRRNTENKMTHAGVAAATGEARIAGCVLNIDADSVAIQSSNKPLSLENCELDIRGGDTSAVTNQFSTIDMTGCNGRIVSDSVGITSQRVNGDIAIKNCELSVEAGDYGIMALASDFYMKDSRIDFPSPVSYGIYAGKNVEIAENSVVNGQNCTFACRLPAASGVILDGDSAVNGVQIFNDNKNVMAMGTVSLDAEHADTLGEKLTERAFEVACGAEVTVMENAIFDISSAASADIRGELINCGTIELDGATVKNSGKITNWGIVEETEDTALQNDGEIYSVCTEVFAVKGNDILLMHDEQPAVIEDIIAATCAEDGRCYLVTYCGGCKAELHRDIEVFPKTGHDWSQPIWNWSDDGKSCSATFICKNDSSHIKTLEAVVTRAEKTPATCVEDGATAYTATAELAGETYTSVKDVFDIPAHGHIEAETINAEEATCSAEGYTGDRVCKVCGAILETGKTIAKTVHAFDDGKCAVCGIADPDCVSAASDKADRVGPKTGDSGNMTVWLAVMLTAGVGMAGTTVYGRKKKNGR